MASSSDFEFEFDSPINEDPEDWELPGGPYDESIFRCSSGVLNTPPKVIRLELDISSVGNSLGTELVRYKRSQEELQNGEPIGDLCYRFVA